MLTAERQNARISEIKNGRLGLYGAEHSKCNHMTKLVFKGLIMIASLALIYKIDNEPLDTL